MSDDPRNTRELLKPHLKVILFGVGYIILICWLFSHWFGQTFRDFALIRQSQTVTGLVVDSDEDVDYTDYGKAIHWYFVVYEFQTPTGKTFAGGLEAEGKLKSKYSNVGYEGVPIEIEYLPSNPDVNRIKGNGYQSLFSLACWTLLRAAFVAGICLPGVGMIYKELKEIRTERLSRLHTA